MDYLEPSETSESRSALAELLPLSARGVLASWFGRSIWHVLAGLGLMAGLSCVLFLLVAPPLNEELLVEVRGEVSSLGETEGGVLEIRITARPELFTIAKADREYLDEVRFWADFHEGQDIALDVFAWSGGREERVVFGVRSVELTYMQAGSVVESRLRERRIIRYVMVVSILAAVASLLLGVQHHRRAAVMLSQAISPDDVSGNAHGFGRD